MPSVPHISQTWLLGWSPSGSNPAVGIGIGYTFAGFINPAGAAPALRTYRQRLQPQGLGLDAPRAILAVNVTVGDNTEDGLRLVNGAKGYYARLARVGRAAGAAMVPTPDEAVREVSDHEHDEPTSIVGGQWPRFVAGGPDDVRATLEQMVDESGADEVMIQDLIAEPHVRRRSHELLAVAFGLSSAGLSNGVAPLQSSQRP